MTSLLTLVVLVLAAFLGAFVFRHVRSDNALLNSVSYTGLFYIILGFVLGPYAADIINQDIIRELNIIYSLVLGWAGFLIGLQTNVKRIQRFPRKFYVYSISNFSIVIIVSFVIFIFMSHYFGWEYGVFSLLVLSISGAVTSPILFGVFARDYKVIPESSYLFQFSSAFDNILGVILFGVILAAGNINFNHISSGYGLFYSLAVSVIAIVIYYFLSKEFKKEDEKLLLLIGLLLIVTGAAFHFKQSIIFISFIFGFGLANSRVKTRGLLREINQIEKPMYVLLLIFVGVNLTYDSSIYFLIFIFFFFIHLVSKLLSGFLTLHTLPEKLRLGPFMGMGNLGMGGLSLAMILDFYLIKQSLAANIFLFAVTITLIIQDAMSWYYLRKVLVKDKKN